jgi:hypothetical protein
VPSEVKAASYPDDALSPLQLQFPGETAGHDSCCPDWPCAHCQEHFSTRKNLERHLKETCERRKVLRCPHEGCSATFTRPYKLRDHDIKEHHLASSVAYEEAAGAIRSKLIHTQRSKTRIEHPTDSTKGDIPELANQGHSPQKDRDSDTQQYSYAQQQITQSVHCPPVLNEPTLSFRARSFNIPSAPPSSPTETLVNINKDFFNTALSPEKGIRSSTHEASSRLSGPMNPDGQPLQPAKDPATSIYQQYSPSTTTTLFHTVLTTASFQTHQARTTIGLRRVVDSTPIDDSEVSQELEYNPCFHVGQQFEPEIVRIQAFL